MQSKSISKEFKRIIRALDYYSRWLFLEYPLGIDFSKRVKNPAGNKEEYNGYAKTSKRALKNLLKNIDCNQLSILDIGSGKCSAVCDFKRLGFNMAHGIEYNKNLHLIAKKNIDILRLNKYCRSINVDATEFTDYALYDVYFLFNPFDSQIYAQVMAAIKKQIENSKKPRILNAYGKANYSAIEGIENISCIEIGVCPYRITNFRIYKIN